MPAPIIGGIGSFIQQQLNVTWWDGEVPRYDVNGVAINPDATGTNPPDWPVVQVDMPESGFDRNPTFEDPYDDEGTINITIYGITRLQTETTMCNIEELFYRASNWPLMSLPLTSPNSQNANNPYYVIKMLLRSWYSINDKYVRLMSNNSPSALCYRAGLAYDVDIHGAISAL